MDPHGFVASEFRVFFGEKLFFAGFLASIRRTLIWSLRDVAFKTLSMHRNSVLHI